MQSTTRKVRRALGQEWDGIKKCFLKEMVPKMCLKSLTLMHNGKTVAFRTRRDWSSPRSNVTTH